MDPKEMLKIQNKLQDSEEFVDVFSKLVSGKSGYKTVIEKSKPLIICKCGHQLEGTEKFCPECGTKVEKENSS